MAAVPGSGAELRLDVEGRAGCLFEDIVDPGGSQRRSAGGTPTDDDHAHIEFSEGVLIGNYRRVELAVEPLAPCAEPPALVASLASDRRDDALRPSARYMGLVVDGAREHGLPGDYVAWLEAVPTGESSAVARAFCPLADAVMRLRRS